MTKASLHLILVLLILLNGMGHTLIQVQFYLDREQITALYCVNTNKPELQCEGKCELNKRLSEANDESENKAEITLEELNLSYFSPSTELIPPVPHSYRIPTQTPPYQGTHCSDPDGDFFHPPQA